MSKTDNLHDYLADLADAIREKKGTTEPINAQRFAEEIRTIESGNGWTGHADVEGLKAIGWDDEDIAYYQKHGVNWNEEDDQYHLVSDDNKALYGVLTADNIQDHKDRIVYLPKIDTSGRTSIKNMFEKCYTLIAIPMLDTSSVTNASNAFFQCFSLRLIPLLDFSNVTTCEAIFNGCQSLLYVPYLNFDKAKNTNLLFRDSYSIQLLNHLGEISTSTYASYLFRGCNALISTPIINFKSISIASSMFHLCYSLRETKCKNLSINLGFNSSPLLSKESLLYLINNEAATEAITITLHAIAYQRLAEDADVVAALANHPLISLASA